MTDKLTDSEIIKALECHSRPSNSCGSNCPYLMCEEVICTKKLSKDALDLINRQKAEIEKLAKVDYFQWEKDLKAEAYKECIEKVKEIMRKYCGEITEDDLDNILKEMEEE